MQNIFANVAVSVSELKKNPSAVMTGAAGMPVAVLNHNRVMGYMVPAELYEAMMERLEDLELSELAKSRMGERAYRYLWMTYKLESPGLSSRG